MPEAMLQSPRDSGLWIGPLSAAGGGRIGPRDLIANAGRVEADAEVRVARATFDRMNVPFLAAVCEGQVVGLCSRTQFARLLGSEFGYSVFGKQRIRDHMIKEFLWAGVDAPLRELLDKAVARQGEAFYRDVILVEPDGSLAGLVPMEALIRAQGQLVAQQFEALGRHRMELARINADLSATVEQLNLARSRYAALFESAALAVGVLTSDGALEEGNTLLCALLGMDVSGGGRGGRVAELMPEPDRTEFLRLLRALLDQGGGHEPIKGDFRLEVPDRGDRIMEVHMRAIPGAGRVCASLEDMTERRGMERLLAQREKHALMETLVGGIAHELNNKLLPIMGFADLLKVRAASGGSAELIESYCERIGASAQAAAKIVRALLQMSKPGFDELSVFDLRAVVKDALAMVNYRLEKAGVITTLSLSDRGVPVLGDAAQIHQLLVNLVLNSCDAMEASAAHQLGISVGLEGGHAMVRVEDTGCGISDDVLGRVFDPFFTTKGPQKGTGLGLTVCFGIVRRHHGVISVERTGPGGTVFLIELPLAKEPAETTRIEGEGNGGGGELGLLRVLVVEDDQEGAAFFGDALRSHLACEVDIATSGEEGRARMEATDFDLVICDVRMPGMSGVELLEWARASRRAEADRILLVTGNAGDVEVPEGVGGQRPAVLSKPFTVQEFLEACVGVMRRGARGSVKMA